MTMIALKSSLLRRRRIETKARKRLQITVTTTLVATDRISQPRKRNQTHHPPPKEVERQRGHRDQLQRLKRRDNLLWNLLTMKAKNRRLNFQLPRKVKPITAATQLQTTTRKRRRPVQLRQGGLVVERRLPNEPRRGKKRGQSVQNQPTTNSVTTTTKKEDSIANLPNRFLPKAFLGAKRYGLHPPNRTRRRTT